MYAANLSAANLTSANVNLPNDFNTQTVYYEIARPIDPNGMPQYLYTAQAPIVQPVPNNQFRPHPTHLEYHHNIEPQPPQPVPEAPPIQKPKPAPRRTEKSGPAVHRCHLCNKLFKSERYLKFHVAEHLGDKPHQCEICHKSFACPDSLKYHKKLHVDVKPFECSQCHKKFARKAYCDEHIKNVHEGAKPFKCESCGRTFSKKSTMNNHIKSYHSANNDKSQFECQICHEYFRYRTSLLKHKLEAHVDDRSKCIVPDENSSKYICLVCDKSFNSKKLATDHNLKEHAGYKPHKCEHCDKFYFRKADLKVHQAIHLADKPFKCNLCPKEYSYKSDLKNHVKSHMPGHYKCDTCEKLFKELSQLKRHQYVHTSGKQFECNLCTKSFRYPDSLKKHKTKYHDDEEVEQEIHWPPTGVYDVVEVTPEEKSERQDPPATSLPQEASHASSLASTAAQLPPPVVSLSQGAVHVVSVQPTPAIQPVFDDKGHTIDTVYTTDQANVGQIESIFKYQDRQIDRILQQTETQQTPTPQVWYMQQQGYPSQRQDQYPVPMYETQPLNPQLQGYQNEENLVRAAREAQGTGIQNQESGCVTCHICSKKLKSERNLKHHMALHTGNRPFVCHICNKGFIVQDALKSHLQIHAGKPHKCHICVQAFAKKSYLQDHIKYRHEGIKKIRNEGDPKSLSKIFRCNVCNAEFLRKYAYNMHMVSHSEYRPHNCALCQRAFKTKQHMNKHIREVHHNGGGAKCQVCGKILKSMYRLKIHMRYTHSGTLYPCNICNKVYKDKRHFTEHMAIVHEGSQKNKCEICGKVFARLFALKKHIVAVHLGTNFDLPRKAKSTVAKIYRCLICRKTFPTPRHLRLHTPLHARDHPFKCPICDRSFAKQYSLKVHLMSHPDNPKPYPCKLCEKSYVTNYELKQHVSQFHESKPAGAVKAQEKYKCEQCDKSFAKQGILDKHFIAKHTGVHHELSSEMAALIKSVHRCELCNKAFITPSQLRLHMPIHTNEKPYKCDICSRTFAREISLKMHMFSHTGGRPFPCSQCNKSYVHKYELTNHFAQVHDTARPFQCPKCGKGFSSEKRLRKHSDTHNEDKREDCPECSKTFSSKIALKNHLAMYHNQEIRYRCQICDKGFYESTRYNRHMVLHTDPEAAKNNKIIRYRCEICDRGYEYQYELRRHMKSHVSVVEVYEAAGTSDVCNEDSPCILHDPSIPDFTDDTDEPDSGNLTTPKVENEGRTMILENTGFSEKPSKNFKIRLPGHTNNDPTGLPARLVKAEVISFDSNTFVNTDEVENSDDGYEVVHE